MIYIKDIFKASVCSFCENIYEYNSINEEEFVKSFKSFLSEEDLQTCLEICTSEITYDIENIENICANFTFKKYNQTEIENIVINCKEAYLQTIQQDKTINTEAFVDNLSKIFLRNYA